MTADTNEFPPSPSLLTGKERAASELIPICSHCRRIRDAEGNWFWMADYVLLKHPAGRFTHGICLECAKEFYPDFPELWNQQ